MENENSIEPVKHSTKLEVGDWLEMSCSDLKDVFGVWDGFTLKVVFSVKERDVIVNCLKNPAEPARQNIVNELLRSLRLEENTFTMDDMLTLPAKAFRARGWNQKTIDKAGEFLHEKGYTPKFFDRLLKMHHIELGFIQPNLMLNKTRLCQNKRPAGVAISPGMMLFNFLPPATSSRRSKICEQCCQSLNQIKGDLTNQDLVADFYGTLIRSNRKEELNFAKIAKFEARLRTLPQRIVLRAELSLKLDSELTVELPDLRLRGRQAANALLSERGLSPVRPDTWALGAGNTDIFIYEEAQRMKKLLEPFGIEVGEVGLEFNQECPGSISYNEHRAISSHTVLALFGEQNRSVIEKML